MNSEAAQPVISKLACSLVGQTHAVKLILGSRAHQVYGNEEVVEQFRCSYGLNPAYREMLDSGPLQVSGVDTNGAARIIEIPGHRFYIATLFLPQLSSRPETPHPLLLGFLEAALHFQQNREIG